MFDRYFIFRKMMDFVAECCEVTDADMNNYAGRVEISGENEKGATITIKVELKEGDQNGN